MPTATFRFYEELNDFLSPDYRKKDFQVQVSPGSTIEDLVGAPGVAMMETPILTNRD